MSVLMYNVSFQNGNYSSRLVCNDTCCTSSTNSTICWADNNFPTNLTRPEAWEMGLRWSYASLVTLMAVLGNLSIIIILIKNRLLLRTSVNHFILNMSVADLITALAGPILFTIRDTNEVWVLGEGWCYIEGFILMLGMLVSVTSLAIISFDRMLGVVRPFHQHLKKRESIVIILFVWVASALFAVPFAIYRIYTEREWQDMTERLCKDDEYKMYVWYWVNIALLNWLPLTVMVISYSTIFVSFKRNTFTIDNREHPGMTYLKRRVVRMMFVLVMAFTVCWIPYQILTLSKRAFIDSTDNFYSEKAEESYKILLTVSQYMMYTNPAVNPIVYALMHQTFRRAFRVTFPCFFNHKSELVLTPGEGMQKYVWSVRSTASNYFGNDVVTAPKRNLRNRLRGTKDLTSSALLSTTALAASIVMEPGTKDTQNRRLSRNGCSGSLDSASSSEATTRTRSMSEGSASSHRYKSKKRRGRGRSWSEDGEVLSSKGRTGPSDVTIVVTEVGGDLSSPKLYVNEGYVRDLPPTRFSIVSTGVLGDLITQVIVEETSSDIENERIL